MRYLRLIAYFIRASAQQELAYRANLLISLVHTLLNLATGVLGLAVLFGQVSNVRGWDFPATLALLGVYLTIAALRSLFIGPSLEALAGLGGEVWTGTFDWTLLRPLDVQFQASFRRWRPLVLFDLALGLTVLAVAIARLGLALTPARLMVFLVALAAGVTIVYAMLLALTALIFWSPGVLFTWLFDGVFQMARYPVTLYPGWLRLALTWAIPIAVITTIPAQALTGELTITTLLGGVVLALGLLAGASALFRLGLRRYASASS